RRSHGIARPRCAEELVARLRHDTGDGAEQGAGARRTLAGRSLRRDRAARKAIARYPHAPDPATIAAHQLLAPCSRMPNLLAFARCGAAVLTVTLAASAPPPVLKPVQPPQDLAPDM